MYRLLAITAAFIIAGCGSGTETDDGGGNAVNGVSAGEIVIGSHTDLSGPAGLHGRDSTNAARMRFDEVNEAGGIHGRQIRFIVEDTQYQVPKAIQAVNKLVNRDKVFAMFLGMGTPMNNAVKQTLFDANVPNLFPLSGGRQMVEPFHRLQFTGRGIYYDEVRAGLRYFVEERGVETICVAYQDTDYGIETLDAATDQAAAMGLDIAATSAHKPTDTEFTASVLRLQGAGCDIVMMGTIYRDTMLFFEAARKIGWEDVAFVGQNASFSKAVAQAESGAAEGYFAFVHIATYPERDARAEVREWHEKFVERFGYVPDYGAIEGYRNADVVVEALQRAGPGLTVDALIAGLESLTEYEDMFGYRMTFGPDDHKGVDESVLVTVEDGRWVTLAESIAY